MAANVSNSNNNKKEGFGAKVKGTFAELKKVSWPSFKQVVKQTGVVLAVTLFFLLILLGMDSLLGVLNKLLLGLPL